MASAQTHRLLVDTRAGTYHLTVQQGQEFVAVASDLGDVYELPEGYRIELTLAEKAQEQDTWIEFYATGRTQVATVRIVYGRQAAAETHVKKAPLVV